MRQLASEHKDIGEDNPKENRKHFFQGELEEFYKGLRSVVEFPALVVEGFKLDFRNVFDFKNRESAFTVVYAYKDHEAYEQITEAFSNSEDVGLEILRRMLEDAQEVDCQIRIDDISGIQIQNEKEKYCGIRFSFTLYNGNDTDINPDKWNI
jgi:hypothetical protein